MKEIIKRFRDFFRSPSYARTLTFIGIVVLAIALPVTIILLQQQTNIQQHASSSCTSPSYCVPTASDCGKDPRSSNTCPIKNWVCCKRTATPTPCPIRTYQGCYGDYYCTISQDKFCSQRPTNCQHIAGRCGYTTPDCGSIGGTCVGSANKLLPPAGPYQIPYANTSCQASGKLNGKCSTAGTYCCKNSEVLRAYDTGTVCIGPDGKSQGTCFYNGTPNDSGAVDAAPKTAEVVPPAGRKTLYVTRVGANDGTICSKSPPAPNTQYNSGLTVACLGTGSEIANPKCTDGTRIGTCYTSNSCASGDTIQSINKTMNNVTYKTCGSYPPPSSGTSWRICCAPPSASTKTYGSCGGSGQYKCTLTKPASQNIIYSSKAGDTSTQCGRNTKGQTGTAYCVCGILGAAKCPSGGGGGGGGGATPTPIPPKCTNGKITQMALHVKSDGVGNASFDNHTPVIPDLASQVVITDKNNAQVFGQSVKFIYSPSAGTFNSAKINLGTKLVCGNTYTLKTKLTRYLTVKHTVTYGQDQTIALNPLQGDINFVDSKGNLVGDDKIDINDYALVRACKDQDPNAVQQLKSGSATVNVACKELINFFYYPDGGTKGDEWSFNYNLWIRNFIKANGF